MGTDDTREATGRSGAFLAYGFPPSLVTVQSTGKLEGRDRPIGFVKALVEVDTPVVVQLVP